MTNIIYEYVTEQGKTPYSDWLNNIKDKKAKAIVMARVDRMELGNLGDTKPVGDGVFELRIHYGPAYRVYYAQGGNRVYLLLCGGDKSTQKMDIKKAKQYWSDHCGSKAYAK